MQLLRLPPGREHFPGKGQKRAHRGHSIVRLLADGLVFPGWLPHVEITPLRFEDSIWALGYGI